MNRLRNRRSSSMQCNPSVSVSGVRRAACHPVPGSSRRTWHWVNKYGCCLPAVWLEARPQSPRERSCEQYWAQGPRVGPSAAAGAPRRQPLGGGALGGGLIVHHDLERPAARPLPVGRQANAQGGAKRAVRVVLRPLHETNVQPCTKRVARRMSSRRGLAAATATVNTFAYFQLGPLQAQRHAGDVQVAGVQDHVRRLVRDCANPSPRRVGLLAAAAERAAGVRRPRSVPVTWSATWPRRTRATKSVVQSMSMWWIRTQSTLANELGSALRAAGRVATAMAARRTGQIRRKLVQGGVRGATQRGATQPRAVVVLRRSSSATPHRTLRAAAAPPSR